MVGREKEVSELLRRYERQDAQFIAVYGRRRVGKTYLVDETFKDRITFRHAGLSPIEMNGLPGSRPLRKQLKAFYFSLISQGMPRDHMPADWLEAFFMLEMHLQSIDDGTRQVVFLDELPWMDTARSGFITALEAFWNGWACHRNVMLIISGSATSWIKDKLINNHGGLYGRVTCEIKLEPFTLYECEALFRERGIRFSRYDIVQAYMILGGIPYYLDYFRRGLSLAQNIDELFFGRGAPLRPEYDRLFSSVFGNPDVMKSIIGMLGTRSMGYSRQEIASRAACSNGGDLTESLNALIASDFVMKYVPFGYGKREVHYKLIDPFCIFYLRFVENNHVIPDTFWQQHVTAPAIASWRGYAFENVCFNHIPQIKRALGIGGIGTEQSAWTKTGEGDAGTQIDLLITRRDNVVNMCEIKFYSEEFTVDRKYDLLLRHRQNLLQEAIPQKCIVHKTLITTYGIKDNEYRWSFDNVITMDALFENP